MPSPPCGSWPPAVLALAAVILAFFYEFLIAISAGLCGEHARWWIHVVAVAVPLIVVGSWGLLHGWWILAAWPAAVFAAASCLVLANYLQSGAHGHCETMTPYEFWEHRRPCCIRRRRLRLVSPAAGER